MPTDPKTGTSSKFVMGTHFLFWKLTEIGKHLRDCSEDIIAFAKLLASRLDFMKKPTMRPWDFANEWRDAVVAAIMFRNQVVGPQQDFWHAIKHMPSDRLIAVKNMMPMFAEDLCGKDFAEVTQMAKEDQLGKVDPFSYVIKPSSFRQTPPSSYEKLMDKLCEADDERLRDVTHCHHFPPEKPVMESDSLPGHQVAKDEEFDRFGYQLGTGDGLSDEEE